MILRKLRREEHGKTRKLWEEVFKEDTPEFLDYYYSVKTAENEIYVIEEDGVIRSMLHLNPYTMRIGEKIYQTHYIVAVATEETYRKRGYMAKLLRQAAQDMRENGEPFTFLMPAAEAIYYPHGFRFIYQQRQQNVTGKKSKDIQWEIGLAEKKDCGELAEFSNRILRKTYEVYVERDWHYYERLLQEVESEDGGILLVKKAGELLGFFGYGKGEQYEVIEPCFLEEYVDEFYPALLELTKNEETEVHVMGGSEDGIRKPIIMAKILHIPNMLGCIESKEEIGLILNVLDEPSGESLGTFALYGKGEVQVAELDTEKGEPRLQAAALREEPEQISIGDLTSILFGYTCLEEMNVSQTIKRELGKIKPLRNVFLNEIV